MGKYCALRSRGDDSLRAIPVFPSRMFRHSALFVRPTARSTRRSAAGRADRHPRVDGHRDDLRPRDPRARARRRDPRRHVGAGRRQRAGPHRDAEDRPARRRDDGARRRPLADRPADRRGDRRAARAAPAEGARRGAHRAAVLRRARGGARLLRGDGRVPDHARDRHPRRRRRRSSVAGRQPRAARSRRRATAASPACSTSTPRASRSVGRPAGGRGTSEVGGWPYGLEANRTTLEAFLGYAHEQGVCARRLEPEELFEERVHAAFRV